MKQTMFFNEMNPFSVLYHHTLNESFTLPIGKINLKKKNNTERLCDS